MKNNSYYTEEEKKQRFNFIPFISHKMQKNGYSIEEAEIDPIPTTEIEDFDGIVKELEKKCDENNLQFQEDWVHIDTEIGVATVQNEYGRILASIHF